MSRFAQTSFPTESSDNPFSRLYRALLKLPFFKESLSVSLPLSVLTIAIYYSQWLDLFQEPHNGILFFDILLIFVLFFVLLTSALILICMGLSKIASAGSSRSAFATDGGAPSKNDTLKARTTRRLFAWNAKSIFAAAFAIFLLWLPYTCASYPVNMDWDTLNQILQFATDAPVDYGARSIDIMVDAKYIDHDTVLSTLLFGSFWYIGYLLGDQCMGLFVYSVLQSFLCAFSFAVLCSYLRRLGFRMAFCVFAFLFCAFFPLFPDYAATMLKDSLFAPFFLLYFIFYVEAFRSEGEAFRDKRFIVLFALLIICCIAAKKIGVYIIFISSIPLVLALKKHRVAAFFSSIGTIVCYMVVLQCLLYPLLDVESVGRQEMLSVPFQQTAAVAIRFPNDCTEWERNAIDKVLPYEDLQNEFDPLLADPTKNKFKNDATTGDILEYLAAYAAQGVRHPLYYLRVLLKLDGAMLAPTNSAGFRFETATHESISEMEVFEGPSEVSFSRPQNVEILASWFNHMIWWGQHEIGLLGTMGLYGGWLPIAAAIISLRSSRRTFWMIAPITLSMLSLFICPTATARYVLPMMYCAPLLIALIAMALKGGGKSSETISRKTARLPSGQSKVAEPE